MKKTLIALITIVIIIITVTGCKPDTPVPTTEQPATVIETTTEEISSDLITEPTAEVTTDVATNVTTEVTTEAPTTEEPTEPPATVPVETEAPTEAPATQVPATQAPVTRLPVTEAPATRAPVTTQPQTKQGEYISPHTGEVISLGSEILNKYFYALFPDDYHAGTSADGSEIVVYFNGQGGYGASGLYYDETGHIAGECALCGRMRGIGEGHCDGRDRLGWN